MLAGKVWDDLECSNSVVEGKPLSLEMIYVPPLFCDMTMSGLRHLACILQLRDFLMVVLQINTRLSSLKSYLIMVVACSCSKWIMALTHVAYMSELTPAQISQSLP